MSTSDAVYAKVIAHKAHLQSELRDVEGFLAMYAKFASPPQESREGTGAPEATPEGSVSSLSGETAAPDPASYADLLACFHSGQMSPDAWYEHLKADPDLRCWLRTRDAAKAPAEPHPETGNEGGDHDLDATENPSTQVARPVRNQPRPAAAETFGAGMSMQEKLDRLMPVLREAAEADGRVPLSLAEMGRRSDIPAGSMSAVLQKLVKDRLVRRKLGGTTFVVDHKPETTESREGDAGPPAAEPEAPAPHAGDETAAPDARAKADDDGSRDQTGRPLDAVRRVPDEPESVSRPAGGRSSAATSEIMDATSPSGEQPGTRSPALAEAPPRQQPPSTVPKQSEAAFDSNARKPEWYSGKDRLVVQAPAGAPERLAIAGNYLLCGKEKALLAREQAIVMARLIKDWGSPVPKQDLAEELMSRSVTGMGAKAAQDHLDLKRLADLNMLIKPAGLMVLEDKAKWRLTVRQEAGAVA